MEKEQLEKVSYSIGLTIALNIKASGVETIDMEAFDKGMVDVFTGSKPKMTPEEANKYIQEFLEIAAQKKGAAAVEEGKQFLAENAKNEGVVTLKSGLQYKILSQGNGKTPKATDTVKCHYEGRLINGTVFDSSYRRGQAASFPVNGVIAGWVEALQIMPVGSKWQLFIPSDLAYGSRGAGEAIGPNETLIFDIELIDIV